MSSLDHFNVTLNIHRHSTNMCEMIVKLRDRIMYDPGLVNVYLTTRLIECLNID